VWGSGRAVRGVRRAAHLVIMGIEVGARVDQPLHGLHIQIISLRLLPFLHQMIGEARISARIGTFTTVDEMPWNIFIAGFISRREHNTLRRKRSPRRHFRSLRLFEYSTLERHH
jgi:hypothetical protein